ncbi:MAG: hypothetical protein COV74_09665 [Candidatus Omnitrophica bacterium CG11_big_fil_rev_8_21_14_0_20_45_26]|uniref:Methyltransferase domain-containing protein n=1 Tax=Candidatus Abzuiibacterium crystallinum TaxID=1974748 RepID=A0A2H0LLI3_9BACT|nr:MAG: hypothetical protein COV74_09665 [Candidatus Omnitrophica bacterium CG11_big_fil_rev_8_21_14_0_20_45_26]PIW64475.1 MAG: hypothetical protein COW12_05790 [Candidatus Omnitrophica bacterium CG12_big_fil_rev_8_21_14_0_65_45_16]
MKVDDKVNYYEQKVEKVWGGELYRTKYGQGICFSERDVPYTLNGIKRSQETVLEIGSSMGQCYRWLLTKGIDLRKRYTGTDISEEGISNCRKLYPQANWIQGNFPTTEFPTTYDYLHERNSIHHMPEPLACIRKAVSLFKKKGILHMRSRTFHPTVSDIDRSYFVQFSDDGKEITGKYFMNLMNIADIINTILSCGNIRSIHVELSPHVPLVKAKQLNHAHNYVAPEDAYDPDETIYHCYCVIEKGKAKRPQVDIVFASAKQALKHPLTWFRFLKNRKLILSRCHI